MGLRFDGRFQFDLKRSSLHDRNKRYLRPRLAPFAMLFEICIDRRLQLAPCASLQAKAAEAKEKKPDVEPLRQEASLLWAGPQAAHELISQGSGHAPQSCAWWSFGISDQWFRKASMFWNKKKLAPFDRFERLLEPNVFFAMVLAILLLHCLYLFPRKAQVFDTSGEQAAVGLCFGI